jgi:hypothetical protein
MPHMGDLVVAAVAVVGGLVCYAVSPPGIWDPPPPSEPPPPPVRERRRAISADAYHLWLLAWVAALVVVGGLLGHALTYILSRG